MKSPNTKLLVVVLASAAFISLLFWGSGATTQAGNSQNPGQPVAVAAAPDAAYLEAKTDLALTSLNQPTRCLRSGTYVEGNYVLIEVLCPGSGRMEFLYNAEDRRVLSSTYWVALPSEGSVTKEQLISNGVPSGVAIALVGKRDHFFKPVTR